MMSRVRNAQVLTLLLDDIRALCEKPGASPQPQSPAELERRAFVRPESLDTAYSYGLIALESAADHLAALDCLLRAEQYSLAPWTCWRGLLEAAATATWILDPTNTPQERVKRSLALRYSTLVEQRKMANGVNDTAAVKRIDERVDGIESIAIALGYDPVVDRKGRRIGIGIQKPKILDLVESQFNFGNLYRGLSAIAHADSALVSQVGFMNTGDATRYGTIKVRAVPKEFPDLLLANAVALYVRARWMHIVLYGYDTVGAAASFEVAYNQLGLADTNEVRFWRTAVESS